jgi:hypothetical protein
MESDHVAQELISIGLRIRAIQWLKAELEDCVRLSREQNQDCFYFLAAIEVARAEINTLKRNADETARELEKSNFKTKLFNEFKGNYGNVFAQ